MVGEATQLETSDASSISGMPGVVYLTMNTSLRNEVKRMLTVHGSKRSSVASETNRNSSAA